MLDPYFRRIPWIRLGIYLLLGTGVDRLVTPREACFLPFNLERAVQKSSTETGPLGRKPTIIYQPQPLPSVPWYFRPEFVFWILVLFWVAWWMIRGYSASAVLSGLVFLIFGALGTFLLIFAANTFHWETYDNCNLGWLVPTHLLAGVGVIFLRRSWRSWRRVYFPLALAGIALFLVASPLLAPQFYHCIFSLALLFRLRCALLLFPPPVAGRDC